MTTPPAPLPAVLLAAGASSRMGRPKALLPIDGTTFVEHLEATLRRGGCDPVLVVTGRDADAIGARLAGADVDVVPFTGWAAGRTGSLQAGLAALPPGVEGSVLALTDMPWVRPDTVRALLAAFAADGGRHDVLAPRHGDRHGHPVVLRATLFDRIAALPPDAPLRDLLRTVRRGSVPVDDPGVLHDADTPADLAWRPDREQ